MKNYTICLILKIARRYNLTVTFDTFCYGLKSDFPTFYAALDGVCAVVPHDDAFSSFPYPKNELIYLRILERIRVSIA